MGLRDEALKAMTEALTMAWPKADPFLHDTAAGITLDGLLDWLEANEQQYTSDGVGGRLLGGFSVSSLVRLLREGQ